MEFFYPQFKVLSNRRIGIFEYDIILESNIQNELDYIFEVKFYPKSFSRLHLQEAILKLELASKNYYSFTKRFAKPILFVIVQRQNFTAVEFKSMADFIQQKTDMKFYSALVMNFEEFDSLKKEQILELMKKNSEN